MASLHLSFFCFFDLLFVLGFSCFFAQIAAHKGMKRGKCGFLSVSASKFNAVN